MCERERENSVSHWVTVCVNIYKFICPINVHKWLLESFCRREYIRLTLCTQKHANSWELNTYIYMSTHQNRRTSEPNAHTDVSELRSTRAMTGVAIPLSLYISISLTYTYCLKEKSRCATTLIQMRRRRRRRCGEEVVVVWRCRELEEEEMEERKWKRRRW